MRVMIDTNIMISAALFPNGRAAEAFFKAIAPPYEPLICDYVVDELRCKFREKFPGRMTELEAFLFHILAHIPLVTTPEEEIGEERLIRDPKDRPILRAALDAHADLFLTGDKDFLESAVRDPRIISAADFLALTNDAGR
ncbi:MAG: putative toxin-antitoxin system toxin component, PIN family [Clostridia bacterium]|nr:putative toxin-antitoxin system toxin component, PIN family [Clostridia bacterium]